MKNKTEYELDSSYIRRCHKVLQEWGAPLSGWYCDYVYDVDDGDDEADSDELFTCELCRCQKVRYVHVMRHEEYFESLEVGCVCAGIMEGNILAAKERDRQLKNRAERKRHFPERRWFKNYTGNLQLDYKGTRIYINRKADGHFSVYVKGQILTCYHGRFLTNFDMAAYAAFDVVDPAEDITA